MQITISTDGTAEHIGDETAAAAMLLAGSEAGRTKRRASHIEPCSWWLRIAFYACRFGADDGDWLVEWTRTWPCLWQVRVVGGPTWGAFSDRQEAIASEVAWLQENRL